MSFSLRALCVGAVLFALPAHATVFTTTLSGTNEVPANSSTATGSATVVLNGDLLTVDVSFNGLVAPASAAHIHCCTAPGANRPVAVGFNDGFPNATSGTFSDTYDLLDASIYTSGFLAGGTAAAARAQLIAALFAGTAYVNIHNTVFPGGEIRGHLREVSEPAALALLAIGLLGVAVRRRRRAAI
jgi:hypothetical protein